MSASLSELANGINVEKFLHRAIDAVIYKEVTSKELLSFYQDEELSKNREAFETVVELLTKCKSHLVVSDESVNTVLAQHFVEGDIAGIAAVVASRKDDLQKAFEISAVSISSSTLIDFDWKVLLSLSSDTMSNNKHPLVQMKLSIKEDGLANAPPKDVLLEMDRKELEALHAALAQANQTIHDLSH
mmetsp:Transcript_39072/g.100101  ORF Transcript_39072/g.100101 Transcript_39072/m.100101 type:complete len:187 (-) Transcript_39072:265-825(-)